jgi:hypothetical protein
MISRSRYPAFRRVAVRAAGFVASLPFLPEIESSISRWPSIRFLPFLACDRATFCGAPERSTFTLCRRASMRFTTFEGARSAGRSIFSPFCFFLIRSLSASSY